MQNAANCDRVSQQSCDLSHSTFIVDRIELSRVQHCVPICQVDLRLIHCCSRVFEFWEETSRHQIVIILVDLSQLIADLQMRLIVIGKVLFRARNRDTAIGALVADMCRRKRASLARFKVMRRTWCARCLVLRVWAVCVLLHDSRSLPDGRCG